MSRRIQVLIVDDAVIVRRLIAHALSADGEFEVVGSASDGAIALEKIAQLKPDIITLDLDMPDTDGIAALKEIRRRWPMLPVLIFTGMDDPGPREMEAISLGAGGAIRKVPHEGNMLNAIGWVRESLVPALKALSAEYREVPAPVPVVKPPAPVVRRSASRGPAVLAIGASTGGPNALEELIAALPADLGVPILVVQHMPERFTKLLADRLSTKTPFRAAEAVNGEFLHQNHIWVAPGDRHMLVERAGERIRLQTNRLPPENSVRPAVDVLFRSLAEVYGPGCLAVVLTGMGQDGLIGAERIVQAGGQVLVQDESSSVVWGMPGAISRAGLAAGVLPIGCLADEITKRTRGTSALTTRT